MGIKDKLKEFGQGLAKPYPEGHRSWPYQTPEAKEQKRKEKEAYQIEYNKERIHQARRNARVAARQTSGGHGILSSIGKGLGDAGNYGLQMQDNIAGMFGMGEPRKKKNRKR